MKELVICQIQIQLVKTDQSAWDQNNNNNS